jgi:replicative DNA helicase
MASSASHSETTSFRGTGEKDFRGKAKIDPMVDAMRPMPSSHEAEKGVISCMLQAPDLAVGIAQERLTSESFHLEAHQVLFDLITQLHDKTKPVDIIALQQVLVDRKMMDKVGGPAAVAEIFALAASPAHVDHYVSIVEEKFTLRSIISACSTCINRAFEEQEDLDPLVDEVEERILNVRRKRQEKKGLLGMKELVLGSIERMQLMVKDPNAMLGTPSGYKDLDDMTGGLHGGDMFILAARPSMGKTSFVMNIVEHVAVDQGKAAAVFSLEMSAEQLVQRMLCSRARVNPRSIGKTGGMKKSDFPRITQAGSALMKSKILIDDTPSLSIMDMRSKARRWKKTHDIQLIAIDYLQLMRSTSKRAQDNRQQEIAEISSGIKAIAKELSVPVIVLAQLNRNPESRTGKNVGKPKLSDLRESGSIEQDADIVGLLYRPEYYAADEEEKKADEGIAELLIAKHRNGPTGSVPLSFIKEYMRFELRARAEGEEAPD